MKKIKVITALAAVLAICSANIEAGYFSDLASKFRPVFSKVTAMAAWRRPFTTKKPIINNGAANKTEVAKLVQKRPLFAGLSVQLIQQRAQRYQATLLRSKEQQKKLNEKLMKQIEDNSPTDVITQTIALGANVNAADVDGMSALHWAAAKGRVTTVELLLNCNANVGAVDKWGCTPLHRAAMDGRTTIAKLLLENNANVNAGDKYGMTPLNYVPVRYHFSYKETADLLLEHGALSDTEAFQKHDK